jgi:putative ATPase
MSKQRNAPPDLFAETYAAHLAKAQPLAARMRPASLDDFVGQEHFLGPGKLLRRLIAADRLGSLIFHGPPGCGKTSLAHVIAQQTRRRFRPLNAVASGVKELREEAAEARAELESGGRQTILFVDEIHRFSRAQQDVLLPEVEEGRVTLIGTTTQNPFFAINSALISRSSVFSLAETSDGDARRALTALEVGVLSTAERPVRFTRALAEESIQQKAIQYDGTGDEHYDVVSAFIKSLRGSDPDAAIYWLARMLEAGEDPRFIARRLVIQASEDIGNADPQALLIAIAAMQAVELIGLPECQLNLAQATTYLATAPKSNASCLAIGAARKDVREGRTLEVPLPLRDTHYRGSEKLGHGEGYAYPHDFPEGWVDQDYLPEPRRYYEPVDRGHEATIRERLEELRRRKGGETA